MIKTIVKKHPLRNITLDFDDEITSPSFEQEALQCYYEAHDKTWAVKAHVSGIEAQLKIIDDISADLALRRLGSELELEILEDWLGVTELEDKALIDGESTIEIGNLFSICEQRTTGIQALYEKVVNLAEVYNRGSEHIYED